MSRKSEQLQIRVSPRQKAALRRLARAANMDLSSYVLSQALPQIQLAFQEILHSLREEEDTPYALAELNRFLAGLTAVEFQEATESVDMGSLSPFLQCYVAAMVEECAHRLAVEAPRWTGSVPPLARPHFATPLLGLRLHLLHASPASFKRRNIFIDASLGAQV